MKQELKATIAVIRKRHGAGAILQLGDNSKLLDIEVIPSGSLALDVCLGIGGFPRGRIVEIFGTESGGKTTLSLHAIANAQKAGGVAGFIDAEHSFSPDYARRLGVDVDNLLVSQPDNGEQGLEIAESLITSKEVDIVVVDSVAALVPKCELEGDMGQPTMGVQARLMSQGLRKLTAITSKSKTCLVFINQLREKIGVMFGSPETTTGGRALKFYASIRIDIRRSGQVKTGEEKTGNLTKCKVVKNKCAAPFKECEIEIVYGEGISREKDLVSLGIVQNIIEKSGAWYTLADQRYQGEDSIRESLKENPEAAASLEASLRKIYFGEGFHKPQPL